MGAHTPPGGAGGIENEWLSAAMTEAACGIGEFQRTILNMPRPAVSWASQMAKKNFQNSRPIAFTA